jgi:5-methylcytosine-specific restriction endonuclease McrA
MAEELYKRLNCVHCNMPFVPHNPLNTMYCTRSCKTQEHRLRTGRAKFNRLTLARMSLLRVLRKFVKHKERIIRVALAMSRKTEALALQERRAARKCAVCGCLFVAKAISAFLCSPKCSHRRRRDSDGGKAEHRASRKAGKMRKRGATVEKFKDTDVLERDGWRCQICGVATPKKLRGTFKPNAPEVDHIVAIANGGAHAMWNCQCACRKCNGLKNAGPPRGQMGLWEAGGGKNILSQIS